MDRNVQRFRGHPFRRLFSPDCPHRRILMIPEETAAVVECPECGLALPPSVTSCPVCYALHRKKVSGSRRILRRTPARFVCEDCGLALLIGFSEDRVVPRIRSENPGTARGACPNDTE